MIKGEEMLPETESGDRLQSKIFKIKTLRKLFKYAYLIL